MLPGGPLVACIIMVVVGEMVVAGRIPMQIGAQNIPACRISWVMRLMAVVAV